MTTTNVETQHPEVAAKPAGVLVGIDVQAPQAASIAALKWAAAHATAADLSLRVITICPVAELNYFGAGAFPAVTVIDPALVLVEARRALDDVVKEASLQLPVELIVEAGESAEFGLRRASRGARLVVLSAHPHHGLGRLFGSTATALVNHATCPVVVVPARWSE